MRDSAAISMQAADGPEAPARRFLIPPRFAGLGLAAAVTLAWFVVLTVTGSPAADVLRWMAAVVCAVLAPGFVLVRLTRRGAAPLVEDLAWAAPAGCLVALAGWFLDRVLPVSPGAFVFGPVVVLVALTFSAARARILARPAPGWGAGPALAMTGVLLVALAWMVATGLQAYPIDPGAGGTSYYPDVLYQYDLLGELRHSLVPTYPPVAGTSLAYHWFFYAIVSHLDTHTGVIGFDSTLRFGPATLVPAILLLIAVVARRASKRVWAGPIAAVLLGVLSITVPSRWTAEDGTTGILQRMWRASPPQSMGWLASIAAAGVMFAYLRRDPEDRAVPIALLVPFFILTAGSKSSELPDLLAGVALAGAVHLVRREWGVFRRCILAALAILAVFEAASLTIYGDSSYGVHAQLLGVARARTYLMFPGISTNASSSHMLERYPPVVLLTVSALLLLPLLPRLLGLLFQVRYRPGDPISWVTLGTGIAGFAVPFLVRHPAGSEIYFLTSAYPIAVVGAACGYTIAVDRVASRWRAFWPVGRLLAGLGVLAVVGAAVAAFVARRQPRLDPAARWLADHRGAKDLRGASLNSIAAQWWTPTLTLYAALIGVAVLVVVAGLRVARRMRQDGRGSPLLMVSLLTLLLGTGAFGTSLDFGGSAVPPDGAAAAVHASPRARTVLLATRRDAFTAGRYVDRHAASGDVVATNLYCRYSRFARLHRGRPCDARNFIASALTQRHTLVGGWGYADRVVNSAWTLRVAYRNAPFWNKALLDEQYAAFAHPTRAVLDDLYLHHQVRWLFLDLRDKPIDTAALDALAIERFAGPTTVVYQLRAPKTR